MTKVIQDYLKALVQDAEIEGFLKGWQKPPPKGWEEVKIYLENLLAEKSEPIKVLVVLDNETDGGPPRILVQAATNCVTVFSVDRLSDGPVFNVSTCGAVSENESFEHAVFDELASEMQSGRISVAEVTESLNRKHE